MLLVGDEKEKMAIRIKNIKVNGKQVRNLGQVEAAKRIENCIKKMDNFEAEVEVNRFYSDRWYPIKRIEQIIKDQIEMRLREQKERKVK